MIYHVYVLPYTYNYFDDAGSYVQSNSEYHSLCIIYIVLLFIPVACAQLYTFVMKRTQKVPLLSERSTHIKCMDEHVHTQHLLKILFKEYSQNYNQHLKQMLEVWDTHLCECRQKGHHVKAMWKLSACVIYWSDATACNLPVPSDKCSHCSYCLRRNSHTFWLCMQSSFILNSIYSLKLLSPPTPHSPLGSCLQGGPQSLHLSPSFRLNLNVSTDLWILWSVCARVAIFSLFHLSRMTNSKCVHEY